MQLVFTGDTDTEGKRLYFQVPEGRKAEDLCWEMEYRVRHNFNEDGKCSKCGLIDTEHVKHK
jgi:hypothetical protein